jgi:ABC-type multidrug transport system ATPase subunit
LFSSHRIEEVLSFADRVLVLDNGKLIADAPPMDIYKKIGKNGILKIFIQPKLYDNAISLLGQNGFESSMNGKGLRVKVDPDMKIEPIRVLLNSGMEIENFDYEVELF